MENYELIKQVGEGSFGQVFKARRKCDGATVAYKVTRKKGRSTKELKSLRRECEIQKGMRHPNIIQMIDSFETETKIVVVTEYVEKELYEILGKAGRLSEERSQVIACDLVSALHYLHSNRVVHRDMKPQNVLLDPNGVAKLCDFGFARLMSLGTHVLMSIKGTPLYMAPELIDEIPYDHNVDLWSLGCIVYELVTGAPPFQTSSMRHLIMLIRHEEIKWPEYVSANCLSFLQGLLQKDSSQRLTWPELMDHPFVKGRILTVDEEAPRSLTSPLTASLARAKQQQLQSLASRFTTQSKKILEKQIKKIHSQVLKRSDPSASESSTSVDVLLNNLSIRASLRSDLLNADHAICQVDCPIAEEELETKKQQQQQLESVEAKGDCILNINIPEVSELAPAAYYSPCPTSASVVWQLDNANVAVAAVAACYNLKSESSVLKGTNSNSGFSLDELNNECKQTASLRLSSEHEKEIAFNVNNIVQRRARMPDWFPRDSEQPIESDEWVEFLQQSMEEIMVGEIGSFLQEKCMTVFVSPLKNPAASSQVIEYVACLLSLPYVIEKVTSDDLERIQRIYLAVRVVPNLVYAVKLLMSEKDCSTETDASSSTTTNRWKPSYALSAKELDALEKTMKLLCRLVYTKPEFLAQFCDAVFIIPDGIPLFQQLLGLENRKVRVVTDLIAIMSKVLSSESGNADFVDGILLREKSTDDLVDLITKLMKHRQCKLRSRLCVFLQHLGNFSRKTFQRIWGKSLRDLLESLADDRDKSVEDAAAEAISSLKQLPFYNQDKDTWSVIET